MTGHWLSEYAREAALTDRLGSQAEHVRWLTAGLVGEAGSILAEMKKEAREREAYPAYRHRVIEEVGDCLWYLARIATVVDSTAFSECARVELSTSAPEGTTRLDASLALGEAVGDLAGCVRSGAPLDQTRAAIVRSWRALVDIARLAGVSLSEAASQNLMKVKSRWPATREYHPLFDGAFPEEERLPRALEVEFRERRRGDQSQMVLRCNGLNFGDRLTDNIGSPDGYRFHDVFHFSYAVHLGWSPVIRDILRCKRKSDPRIDENEDGRRAAIIEEAVSAIVFSRAKHLRYFDGLNQVDYDLLKTVRGFVDGYEVEVIPLWQWEEAILGGFRVFRQLRDRRGGRVMLDLLRRRLDYVPPA